VPCPTSPTHPLRVAFYTRSAHAADIQQSARQADLARALVDDNPDWTLTEIVTDTGSGLRLQPGLRRLLDHARNRQFELLLVHQLSDLGRSPSLPATILADLTGGGVRLRTLDGTLDTATPTGRFLAAIWRSPAEHAQGTAHQRVSQRRPPAGSVEEG